MLRTIVTMLTIATTAMLLAGCGSSSHTSSIGAPVGADIPIASAQAVAYARTVNLRRADVPGLVPTVRQKEGAGTFLGRCERPAGSGEAAGIPSQAFEENLDTEAVQGVRHPRHPQHLSPGIGPFRRLHDHKLNTCGPRGCRRHRHSGSGLSQGVLSRDHTSEQRIRTPRTLHAVKVSPLHVEIAGLQIQGMRASASLAAGMTNTPNRQPYYQDVLGFSSGPHQIFLKVTSRHANPPQPTDACSRCSMAAPRRTSCRLLAKVQRIGFSYQVYVWNRVCHPN